MTVEYLDLTGYLGDVDRYPDVVWVRQPELDEAEATVVGIAAGSVDEQAAARWLGEYIAPEG